MVTIKPFIPSSTLVDRSHTWTAGGPLKLAISALRHAWRAYIRYKRLAGISDEALAKRGLKRADIGRHAFFECGD